MSALLALALAASPYRTDVHGDVARVDRARGTVTIVHHAHAGMMMEMTTTVRIRDRRALARLRPGAFVRLRCDLGQTPPLCVTR